MERGRLDVPVNAADAFDLAPVVETEGEVLGLNLGVSLAGSSSTWGRWRGGGGGVALEAVLGEF